MPGPQTATNIAELVPRIQQMMRSSATTAFQWKRAERDARTLITVDAVQGFLALGAALAGQFKIGEMHDAYTEAFHYRTETLLTHMNYSVSLLYVGLFEESLLQSQKAIELSQGFESSLYLRAFEMARTLGRYEEALDYLKKLPEGLTEDWDKQLAVAEVIVEVATHRALTASNVSELASAAGAFLRDQNVHFIQTRLEVDGFDRSIVSIFEVAASLERSSEMNARLGEILSAFDGWYTEGFSLQIDSFEDEHQPTAAA